MEEETNEFSLLDVIGQQNITHLLEEQQLTEIAARCVREYDIDERDFGPRKQRIEDLYKLALQTIEEKNYPFPGASNIKYPLLTKAALGFAAMAYPAIVKEERVVKGKPIGNDEGGEELKGANGEPLVDPDTGELQRKNAGLKAKTGERVSKFMSHQVLEDMDGWEDDMDKILHIIPIIGCAFKKTYMDGAERKNVSKLVLPQFLIINKDAKNVSSASRTSELVELYPYEIKELINLGIFRDFDYNGSTETLRDNYSDNDSSSAHVQDGDMPHVFIEQHRRLDLDDDGYSEPYIVWVHKQSNEIARIMPRFDIEDIEADGEKVIRIKAQCWYEDFNFFPDPEGGPYGIGFGHLLQHMNVAINTSVNMIIDQGHMSSLGGGFIGEGVRIKSGNLKFKPNEWKRVKTGGMPLRENIVPMPTKEPSLVLMNMLQFLIENAEEMASLSRFMAGDIPANMPATTALASLEQGIQPFKAVFKRIHRALKKEFKRLFYLNQQYLTQEEYLNVLDDESADVERDFLKGLADVVPVSDPDHVSDTFKKIKAQILLEMKDDPLIDPVEVRKRALTDMGYKDVDKLVRLPSPQVDELVEAQKAALQAQISDLQHQMNMRDRDADRKDRELALKIDKAFFETKKMQADAVKSMAQAEGEEQGQQLDIYKMQLDHLTQLKQELGVEQGRMGELESEPDNGQVF